METKGPVKILILEENQSEIKLVESILFDSQISFESKNAKTENEFTKFVNRFKPDVILSGTNLSKYSVHEALSFLKEQQLLIPFILITGTIPEELAKDYLKYGVDEHLTKYNLLSLPAVITKAIEIKRTEKEKIQSQILNKEHEAKLQTFFDNNPESIFEIGFSCELLKVNNSGRELLGITEAKLASKKIKLTDFIENSKIKDFKEIHANVARGNKRSILLEIIQNKKESVWLDCKLLPLLDSDQNVSSILVIGIDVTEKETFKSDLSSTKSNYESLIASIDEALWRVDLDFKLVEFNNFAARMIYGVRNIKPKIGMPLKEFAKDEERFNFWQENYKRALSGESFRVEQVFDINNDKLYALITFYPVYDKNEIIGVCVLGRDHTASIKAERELKKSEKVFRTLAENAPVGIFKIDSRGNCTYANEYLLKMICSSFEKMKETGWSGFIHFEDLSKFNLNLNNVLESKSKVEFKIRFNDGNKNMIWTKISIAVIDEENAFSGIGTVTNISKLKQAYDDLKDKQTIIDAVEHNSKIGFWIRDLRTDNDALWSDSIYTIFDRKKSDGIIPLSEVVKLIIPDDREEFIKKLNNLRNGKLLNLSYRIVTQAGNLKHVGLSAFPIYDENKEVIKMSGTITDITDLYQRDIELAKQKKLMQQALGVANIGHWEYNVHERTTVWSNETKKMFGLNENDAPLSLEVFIATVYPADRQGFIDFYNSQSLGGSPASFQYRIQVKNELKTILAYSFPFLNDEGQIEKLTGIVIDKTKVKRTEESLLETENLFNSIFENGSNAMFIEDQYGTILNVNKKACEMQGFGKSELIGKKISELLPSNEKDNVMADFTKLFNGEIKESKGKFYKITGEVVDIKIEAMKISYRNIPAVLLDVKLV